MICKVCFNNLSEECFIPKNKSTCKSCLKTNRKKWETQNRGKIIEYRKNNREKYNENLKLKRHRLGISINYNNSPKTTIKNGKDYSPNWENIRKEIYKRDFWKCGECGSHCHNKIKIQCHHIDYDITNLDSSNLITLCSKCHMKTNFNRDMWEMHFKRKSGCESGCQQNTEQLRTM